MFLSNRFRLFNRYKPFYLKSAQHKKLSQSQSENLHSMPVLSDFMGTLQKEFGFDFSKMPNRHSTLLVMVQHGFASIQPLMESLLALGIDPKKIIKTTKPHTTSPEMLDFFHRRFGKNYLGFQWSSIKSEEKAQAGQTPYQIASESTHEVLLEKVCNYLLHYPAPPEIKNIIICDEGGKFLKGFIDRYQNPDKKYTKKLSDYRVVAIEHTKCGTYSEALGRLPFPMINMADSFLKTQIESEFIAKSMITSLKSILATIPNVSNATIGVIGGGNIGEEVLHISQQEYPETSIIFYDQESGVLPASKLKEKGLTRVTRIYSAEEFYKKSGIILGCTGKNITHESIFKRDWLKENPHSQIHFMSCSSGDREFYSLLKQIPEYRLKSVEDIHDWHMELSPETKQKIIIHNGGFPINFLVNQLENIPLHEIQITRTMKLAAIAQAYKLLEIIVFLPNQERYIQLDKHYQHEIIHSFYRNQIKHLTQEEMATGIKREDKRRQYSKKYQGITEDEISQGSVGARQLELNDVISLPFYVKTHHQVQLKERLALQKSLIKRMAITGIAGSGKTILAKYYLQQYQKLHPKHATKMLLAETQKKWMEELQDYAILLCPENGMLIKEIADIEKKKRLIIQSIHAAFEKNTWCVIIDNWDIQHGPTIGEIEEIFHVGNGTLIITTQAPSPFEKKCSLNLSEGFTQEESRQLFLNVINSSSEVAEALSKLDRNNSLRSLLDQLNNFPLGVVQAASFILQKNKTQLQRGQALFSYQDYQVFLNSKVTEVTEAHKKLLKNNAGVPRENTNTRPEFMLIKTQEAAVDLSLEKTVLDNGKINNLDLLKILFFCSFINSDNISQKILKYFLQYFSETFFEKANNDIETRFNSALDIAQNYSILSFDSARSPIDNLFSIQLHRITRKIVREKYWPLYESEILKKQVVFIGKEYFAAGPNVTTIFFHCIMVGAVNILLKEALNSYGDLNTIKTYRTHAVMLNYALNAYFVSQSHLLSNLPSDLFTLLLDFFNTLAATEKELGNYRSAEKIARQVVEKYKAFYKSEHHIKTIISQRNLAVILDNIREHEEAEMLYRNALKTVMAYTDDNEEYKKIRLILSQDLKKLLEATGRLEEANMLSQEIPKINYTGTGIEAINLKSSLAYSLHAMKKNEEAAHLFQEVLDAEIQFFGTENHIRIALTQSALGSILNILGRKEKAKLMLQTALTTATALNSGSTKHKSIASIQNNLALVLSDLGKHTEAEKLFREALSTLIKHYGPYDNSCVTDTQYNLAMLLIESGKDIEAIEFLRKYLTTISNYKSANQLEVASLQAKLGHMLIPIKCYAEAEDLLRKSLATITTYYKTSKNLKIADIQQTLATALMLQGRDQEASALYQESLSTQIAHHATHQHIDVAITQCNLAQVLAKSKSHIVEAEGLFVQALEASITCCGTQHDLNVVKIRQPLADYYEAFGRYEDSATQYKSVLNTLKICYGDKDNASVAIAQGELGKVLFILGRYEKAEFLLRSAISMMISLYGTERHPNIEHLQKNLKNVLLKLEKNEEISDIEKKIFDQKPKYRLYLNEKQEPIVCFMIGSSIAVIRLDPRSIKDLEDRKFYQEANMIKEMLIDSWKKEYAASIIPRVSLSEYEHTAPDRLIRCAAGNGNEKDLSELLAKQHNKIDNIDNNPFKGWTALHWAIRNNHLGCIQILLDYGAKHTIRDKTTQKLSALDIALHHGNEKVLLLLKKHFVRKYSNNNEVDASSIASAISAAKNSDDLAVVNLLINFNKDNSTDAPALNSTHHCNSMQKT